jgi:hypothetical protein
VYQSNSVDFDFNLDEIDCQQDLDEFLDFVRVLGQQTKRSVSLRYEGSQTPSAPVSRGSSTTEPAGVLRNVWTSIDFPRQ